MNWYEAGMHAIPGSVAVAIDSVAMMTRLPLLGIVATGRPIEPIPQIEQVDVPSGMKGKGDNCLSHYSCVLIEG